MQFSTRLLASGLHVTMVYSSKGLGQTYAIHIHTHVVYAVRTRLLRPYIRFRVSWCEDSNF